MSHPEPTYIYHFTHARNLPAILRAGCVYCQSRLPANSQEVDISHYDIQERRSAKQVRCGAGGVLHDYIPFYFAARSPMMYVLSKGGVKGYESGTKPLIYLVSTVQRVKEMGLEFVFSDGHPTIKLSHTYDDITNLVKIDWKVMRERYWKDREEDPDRDSDKKRRRQAEFLVRDSFPWEAIEFLAVKEDDMKVRLEKYLREQWPNHVKPVRVESGWYF